MRKFWIYSIATANLAVIIVFWLLISGRLLVSGDGALILISLGRISGLLLVYFVLQQLVLIGRFRWIEQTFGMDKLSRYHHWLGYGIIFFLLAHPLLLASGYSVGTGFSWLGQLIDFIINGNNIFPAAVAVLLFIAVLIFSVIIVFKKLKYETWYFIHLLVYLAILLAFSHQLGIGTDLHNNLFAAYWYALYLFVGISFVWYRFFKPIRNFIRYGFIVEKIVQESSDVVSIYMTGKDVGRYKIKAGQFMIFRFLAKGFWWQTHPFSLSCAPNSDYIRISVKASGDFTSQLKNLPLKTKVLIDGPYGVFTESFMKKDRMLLIAGGIGITPIRSLIEVTAKNKNIVLFYASRNVVGTVFKDELDKLSTQIHFPVYYVMSNDSDWKGEKGFVDEEKIKRLAPDFAKREIYLCGPEPMMKAVVKILDKIGFQKQFVHFEKFSL